MHKFNDFNIKPAIKVFVGDKIKMSRILNRVIVVHDYKIVESKFQERGPGKCLHLQIGIGDVKHVVFTSSSGLIEAINQVPASGFPFETTIIEQNDRYEFS